MKYFPILEAEASVSGLVVLSGEVSIFNYRFYLIIFKPVSQTFKKRHYCFKNRKVLIKPPMEETSFSTKSLIAAVTPVALSSCETKDLRGVQRRPTMLLMIVSHSEP